MATYTENRQVVVQAVTRRGSEAFVLGGTQRMRAEWRATGSVAVSPARVEADWIAVAVPSVSGDFVGTTRRQTVRSAVRI
jgi:hypothetical protein